MATSFLDDGSVHRFVTVLLEFFASNPPTPGSADVLCYGPNVERDAAAVATCLLWFTNEDTNQPVYSNICVLVNEGEGQATTIHAQCAEAVSRANPEAPEGVVERALERRLHFHSARSFEFDAILETINDLPDQSALVVVNAALYRPHHPVPRAAERTESKTPFGEVFRNVIPEDEWSSALAELANLLQTVAEQRQIYVLLF